jgi:hypothetical protein
MKKLILYAIAGLVVGAAVTFIARADTASIVDSKTIDISSSSAPACEIFRSNDKTFQFTTKQGGTAVDISSTTVKMEWYCTLDATGVVPATVTLIDGGSNGVFNAKFDAADVNYAAGQYVYAVSITDSSDNVLTWNQGQFTIKKSPITTGTSTNAFGQTRNYSDVTNYQGVATSGPYRAGNNITFTANADGSQDINTEADGNPIDSRAATNTVDMGTNAITNLEKIRFVLNGGDTNNGCVYASLTEDTLNYVTAIEGVVEQLGQELQTPAKKNAGDTLNNGDMVYVIGGSGDKPLVQNAATNNAAAKYVAGLSTHDWTSNDGRFTSFGLVRDLNTLVIGSAGAKLYRSNSGITTNETTGDTFIGWITRSHATEGVILVNVDTPHPDPPANNTTTTNFAQTITVDGNVTSTAYYGSGANLTGITQFVGIACSDLTTALTTGTDKGYWSVIIPGTLQAVHATVLTAPTGSDILVDINKGGVSILTNKIEIEAGETDSRDASPQPSISDTAMAEKDRYTIDIDAVGSTTGGAGIIVYFVYTP